MIWRYDVFRQSEGQLQGEALAGRLHNYDCYYSEALAGRLHNYDCGGSEGQLQGRSTRGAITQLRCGGSGGQLQEVKKKKTKDRDQG